MPQRRHLVLALALVVARAFPRPHRAFIIHRRVARRAPTAVIRRRQDFLRRVPRQRGFRRRAVARRLRQRAGDLRERAVRERGVADRARERRFR